MCASVCARARTHTHACLLFGANQGSSRRPAIPASARKATKPPCSGNITPAASMGLNVTPSPPLLPALSPPALVGKVMPLASSMMVENAAAVAAAALSAAVGGDPPLLAEGRERGLVLPAVLLSRGWRPLGPSTGGTGASGMPAADKAAGRCHLEGEMCIKAMTYTSDGSTGVNSQPKDCIKAALRIRRSSTRMIAQGQAQFSDDPTPCSCMLSAHLGCQVSGILLQQSSPGIIAPAEVALIVVRMRPRALPACCILPTAPRLLDY